MSAVLTLLTLAALLQAPPAPLISFDAPPPSLEASAPSASEPREVTQLAAFVGKNLLSFDLSAPSVNGLKLRQGERTFSITDDLSGPMHLVPSALALAVSAQRDYQTGMTLMWVSAGVLTVGLALELSGLLLLSAALGVPLAIVGVVLALSGLVPMLVSTRFMTDGITHFSESVALYNRGLLELRPPTALTAGFSAPPLLRF